MLENSPDLFGPKGLIERNHSSPLHIFSRGARDLPQCGIRFPSPITGNTRLISTCKSRSGEESALSLYRLGRTLPWTVRKVLPLIGETLGLSGFLKRQIATSLYVSY